MADDAVQYVTAAIRVVAVAALLAAGIGFRRILIILLAGFAAAHTGIYIALLAGAHLGEWTITVGGSIASGLIVLCVAAAFASRGERERLTTELIKRGGCDKKTGWNW